MKAPCPREIWPFDSRQEAEAGQGDDVQGDLADFEVVVGAEREVRR